MIDRIFEPC